MNFLSKTYQLYFYKLYSFFNDISEIENNGQEYKALAVLCASAVWFFFGVFTWVTAIFELNFTISNPVWVIALALLIIALNYFYFIHDNRWKKYAKHFKRYPKWKRQVTNWMTLLFLIGLLAFVISGFYQLSLVEWEWKKMNE
jgi:F0F1-type ATP synthase membrane subunit a